MTGTQLETVSRDLFPVSILFDVPDCGSRALIGRTTTTTATVARGTKKWIRVSAFSISRGRRRCCTVVRRWSSCCANAWLLETSSHGHRKLRPGRKHGILNTGLIGIFSGSTPIFNEEASGKWIVVGKKKISTHKLRNRLSFFYLLSKKNVTHDDFFPSSRYLFWFDREFAVSPVCGADVPKLLERFERRSGYICM